jgi:hypothetical protein
MEVDALLLPDDEGEVLEPLEVSLDDKDKDKKDEPEGARKAAVVEPDTGIAAIKKQLADEKLRREAEERRRQAAEQDAAAARTAEHEARTETAENRLHLVNTAIASATQSLEVGQSQYADALAAGDHARAAAVNREMVVNAAKLATLEQRKVDIEQAPKVQVRQAADPVENLASRLSPRSAAWVRAHPDYALDPKLNRKMLAAHELAVASDLAADSDDYFRSIESTLGLQGNATVAIDEEVEPAAAAVTPRRSSAPASAPVSRSGNGTSNGRRPGTFTLSPAQQDAARTCGMSNEQYARELLAMEKEKDRLN